MSRFSGKCDLADHVMMEVMRNAKGELYDFTRDSVGYSDPYECFLKFKEATGGVIYQSVVIPEVNRFNADFVAKKVNDFNIIEHSEEVPDKRAKTGKRVKKYRTYEYFGKPITLKELNKKTHLCYRKKIHFNTLLELIPYFPYIISMCSASEGKEIIYISNRPYYEEEEERAAYFGHEPTMREYYRKALVEFMATCTLKYYNPEGHEIVEEVEFDPETRIGNTSKKIDSRFPVSWFFEEGKVKSHWTSPKRVGDNQIEMSDPDIESYLGTKQKVRYVEYFEPKRYLD